MAAALATGLLLGSGSAWAQSRFKPDVMRSFGGSYASNCSNPAAARLRIQRDALVVEQGDKRIVGRNVTTDTGYYGASQMPNFQVALVSTVRSGAKLDFVVFEEKSTVSITVQADAALQVALGKAVLSGKYRRCEDAKRPLGLALGTASEPMSDVEKMLLQPSFKAAYAHALGDLAHEHWLFKLDGPRPPMRRTRVAGIPYEVVAVCKPHLCSDNNAVLLYAQDQGLLYGKVYLHGGAMWIGTPPPAVADRLEALWLDQWQRR